MIDYLRLSDASKFYKKSGYEIVDLDRISLEQTITMISSSDGGIVSRQIGHLTGSAEQAFLHMANNLDLAPGKYQSTNPCFSLEPNPGPFHQFYFMKNELFWNEPGVGIKEWSHMVSDSVSFFSSFLEVEVVSTGKYKCDIVSKGKQIELGSYGISEHLGMGRWIYGTGCAEPRLTKAIEEEKL